jgi:hypothetical protein
LRSNFDTAGWKWSHSDYSQAATGDSGPWVWWLPLAWRAVADPSGDHPLPPPPSAQAPTHAGDHDQHAYAIAWWSPLLHLLFFGSGWVRPDLGLARWLERGQPDSDPVLRVIHRWWGPRITDVLAWAGREQVIRETAMQISSALQTSVTDVPMPDEWANRRRSPEWDNVWGKDHDRLHLGDHPLSPIWTNHAPGAHMVSASADARPPRAVLTLSSYQGWYKRLHRLGAKLPVRPDGGSWQVDVIVRPLGWLGSYRRSGLTGRWFSGRHRWHELGTDTPFPQMSLTFDLVSA